MIHHYTRISQLHCRLRCYREMFLECKLAEVEQKCDKYMTNYETPALSRITNVHEIIHTSSLTYTL